MDEYLAHVNATEVNATVPWLFDIDIEDTNWIITSSFMIFTMQTGFGMLESGCVSIKNEVNIMMKNVVDIVLGAGWVWGEHGFLKKLGAVDIAGSGTVHLIGGSAAMASAMMLGPRLGRYDNGISPLPLGNPVNAVMGLFVLWWGWLAFNSGSTYGLSGEKWHYAARAAVMTMMSTFGGGTVSILYTMIKLKGKIDAIDIINGILGSLVSITAGCFLYQGWEALIVGSVGALLVCLAMPLFDLMGIDDPVGASAVHGVGGIWGVIAVGIFADNPYPLDTTYGRSGLIKGGGWYLLGIQTLTALCLLSWGIISTIILLWIINQFVAIRMDVHVELMGADLTEHSVKHGQVGVSRALSAFRALMDTASIENLNNVGSNPAHERNINIVKILAQKRRYRLSKVVRNITKGRNLGISNVRDLFPRRKDMDLRKTRTATATFKPKFATCPEEHGNVGSAQMAWVN